jgi:hypothetical protein
MKVEVAGQAFLTLSTLQTSKQKSTESMGWFAQNSYARYAEDI